MREIKFRAWDIASQRMIANIHEQYDSAIDSVGMVSSESFGGFLAEALYKSPLCYIMQYTGLKDKNNTGQEAYEGDLVQNRQGKQGEIIWHQESCGFAIAFGEDEPLGSLSSWFEVVGNKYEN